MAARWPALFAAENGHAAESNVRRDSAAGRVGRPRVQSYLYGVRATVTSEDATPKMNRRDPRTITAILLGIAAAALSLPIIDYLRGDSFLHPLGFESGITGTPAAWVLALLFATLCIAFTITHFPRVQDTWREISFLKLLSLWAAVGAAVVEEAFFRRIIMDGVMGAGGGVPLQIFASAVVFGVAHALWGLIKGSPHVAFTAAGATGIIGAALAVVYVVGDRSLAPCIAAHFAIDAVIQPGLLLSAVSGQWGKTAAVTKSEQPGR